MKLLLLGAHQVSNALAAAAVAHTLGMGTAEIADALSCAVATTGAAGCSCTSAATVSP
ncbi:hypothetical protein ACWIG5_38460 [Streptomyces lydicus]